MRAGYGLLATLVAGATLASSVVHTHGLLSLSLSRSPLDAEDTTYLSWPREQAEALARSTRAKDSAGTRLWDGRGTRTERSARYHVVATWMTPEVIRATARVLQLRGGLSVDETKKLVAEADQPGATTVMIEIDPHEGSGVIPLDWEAYLQPFTDGKSLDGAASGAATPRLRDLRALAGIERRDYAYDRFWMVFPLKNSDGRPLFPPDVTYAELVVRIYDKEARMKWPVPASVRGPAN